MAVMNLNDCNGYGARLVSTGSSITLPLPFDPDMIKVWNYTKFGSDDETLAAVWFKDFPAGDALLVTRGTTDLSSTLETTNGITEANTDGGQEDSHVSISGATNADPVVITTSSNHGLTTGQRIDITKVIGMPELNAPTRQPYQVNVLTSTTFELQDIKGNDIDGTNFGTYSSGGQVNKKVDAEFASPTWNLTLGSAVVGNDSDVLYIEAYKFNLYEDLGDADDF